MSGRGVLEESVPRQRPVPVAVVLLPLADLVRQPLLLLLLLPQLLCGRSLVVLDRLRRSSRDDFASTAAASAASFSSTTSAASSLRSEISSAIASRRFWLLTFAARCSPSCVIVRCWDRTAESTRVRPSRPLSLSAICSSIARSLVTPEFW
jgi:hypothetical protein